MIAGYNSATAVPDVVTIATGDLLFLANPNAKNEDDLSSTIGKVSIFLFDANARVNAVLREPGEIHAYLTPAFASRSTNRSHQTVLRLIDSFILKQRQNWF